MDGSNTDDAVSLLQRAPVLDACHDGPAGRATIAERAGCSRSTAYRATSELSEQGLLERVDRGYRLTGAGAAMLDHVRAFGTKVAGTKRVQRLFEYVDDPELVRRIQLFTDAELVTQDASSPYRVENRVKSIIDDTEERMCGLTTGLGSPALAEAMIERIRAGVRVDWILPTEMYEQFTAEYGELSARAIADGQTSVALRDAMPIDLAVYDETLVVIGFDRDRGTLGAVAITDDRSAVEWAEDRFEECRGEAERVE